MKIKLRLSEGASFSSLKEEFPILTKALYKKLGGFERKTLSTSREASFIKLITTEYRTEIDSEATLDSEVLLGTLMGDAHIEDISNNKFVRSTSYKVGHCWAQLGYLKLMYEVLKKHISNIRISEEPEHLQETFITYSLVTSKYFNELRDLFYISDVTGKTNLQKDVLQERVLKRLTWKSLAFWIMDEGSKYSASRGSFKITIGKQNRYTHERLNNAMQILFEVLGEHFEWREESHAYEILVRPESRSNVLGMILPYIWPDFYYKLGVAPEECGESYRNLDWFKSWQSNKKDVNHPFLEKHTYKEYRETTDQSFKDNFEKSLFSRTIVRGFPYCAPDLESLDQLFSKVKMTSVRNREGVLSSSPISNYFSNFFMSHRYHCKKKGNKSAYEVFLDRKRLKQILGTQLNSGPDISNVNIKNAITTYSGSGVGQFNTGIAKYLVETYCDFGTVLDPCAGWGNRLVGTLAAGRGYYGIEPNSKTFEGLCCIKNWFDSRPETGVSRDIRIVKGVAEDPSMYEDDTYSFSITSPPYFDMELYSDESTQSYLKYPEYSLWLKDFLRVLIKNTYRSLKVGSFFALNVGSIKRLPLCEDTLALAIAEGFCLKDTLSLKPFKRPGMDTAWSEPVFILKKESV